ncbi:hypothetical protein [Desulfovibrio inopinatus]|uniref:hypothetical protein n=1 Tax=Desulfovibrio inopinatus TaxID=102109 RepID=UPI00048806F6|nr:hypothetical protein [Desulfovibrio inopinatus]
MQRSSTNVEFTPDLAARGMRTFYERMRNRIGISKSDVFNDGILDVALADEQASIYACTIQQLIDNGEEVPDFAPGAQPKLLTYLRGIKCVQTLILQALRKTVFDVFGSDILARVDKLAMSKALVTQDTPGEYLWPSLSQFLNKHINTVLRKYVEDDVIRPLFFSCLDEVENFQTFVKVDDSVSVNELPSVPFNYKFKLEFVDLFKLFNADSTYVDPVAEQEEEENPLARRRGLDNSLVSFVRRNSSIIENATAKKGAYPFLKEFISVAGTQDTPRNDPSVMELCRNAEKELDSIGFAKKKLKRAIWGSKRKALKAQISHHEIQFAIYRDQLIWFTRGVINGFEIYVTTQWRKSANTIFKCGTDFHDIVLATQFSADSFSDFFRALIAKRMAEKLEHRLNALAYSLRNEGLVKEYNNRSYEISKTKQYIRLRLELQIKKNLKLIKTIHTVLRINPGLRHEILRCVSLAPTLANLTMRYQEERPAFVKKIMFDTDFASILGDLILQDVNMKALLIQKPGLLRIVFQEKKNPIFRKFMRLVSNAKPAVKNALLGDPLLLFGLWKQGVADPTLAKVNAILDQPLTFEHFRESVLGRKKNTSS